MGLIDFILNVAGLLLWLNWRAVQLDPLANATPATLAGTLKRAQPGRPNRWRFLAGLLGLLIARAFLYGQIGAEVNWTAKINLIVVTPVFPFLRHGRVFFMSALFYSALSFLWLLAVFYIWLLALSLLNRESGAEDPFQKLVRSQLGKLDGWHWFIKLMLPFAAGTAAWWALSWPLTYCGIIPGNASQFHKLAQAALFGLATYLTAKHLVGLVLFLRLLNTYVYFGGHPFWNYINLTARNLLWPLRRLPLRAGRVDLAPVVGIAAVYFLAHLAEHGLLLPGRIRILSLADWYARLQM